MSRIVTADDFDWVAYPCHDGYEIMCGPTEGQSYGYTKWMSNPGNKWAWGGAGFDKNDVCISMTREEAVAYEVKRMNKLRKPDPKPVPVKRVFQPKGWMARICKKHGKRGGVYM